VPREERVIDCDALFTVMVNELVVAVAVLLSVTRTVMAADVTTEGVPVMAPVDALILNPAGRAPDAIANELPPDPPALERESE
jgi:hypothetical protein